jgi:hypothetical protein
MKLFSCEEMCFELLLNNEIQICVPSNDLKFGMFIHYTCVKFRKTSRLNFHLFYLNKI